MIILFLNVNSNMIELYNEKGMTEISFQNARQLYSYVEENSNILYITNAVQTNSTEVINMIKNMGIIVEDKPIVVQEKKTYIHVAGEEIIPIDDLLRFRGHYDAHPLTSDLVQKIKDTPLLQLLIKNKKLELITSSERKKLKEEYDIKENEQVGSILVDREDLEKKINHTDAEVLDFTSDVISSRQRASSESINTMSDLMNEIEGFEK